MPGLRPWVQRIILTGALIAALNCFIRADYNLPLFIFAYMAWGLQRTQKPRIAWMLVITAFFDVCWLLYWTPFYDSSAFVEGYWENGLHSMVIILSWINLGLKAAVVILGLVTEPEVRGAFSPEGAKDGLVDFLSF